MQVVPTCPCRPESYGTVAALTRGWCLWALMVACLIGQGCGSSHSKHAASLHVDPGGYEACFDQVVLLAREQGMPAVLRDRAGGLVETAPRLSGSIFEPWRQDNASFAEGVENTVSLQRRRARFEFVPADFSPSPPADTERLDGPPLPGSKRDDLQDIRTYEGPIEVRIWVYVERAFTPGVRTGSWTRSQTTLTRNPLAAESGGKQVVDRSKWTPVRRDEPYERRLLEALAERMTSSEGAS